MPAFPEEHWEATFTRPGIDPRRDVIIAAQAGPDGSPVISGFCWLYSHPSASRVILRGPFVPPDDRNCARVLGELYNEAIARTKPLGESFMEARSLYSTWEEELAKVGFTQYGTVERWRKFPLQGAIDLPSLPEGIELRQWRSMTDIPVLMRLFEDIFSEHWDYVPPRRESWEEIARGKGFEPRLVIFAEDRGDPVGYAFGERIPDPSGITLQAVYLASIGLRSDHQSRGLGGILLSRWLRAAYDSGLRAAELDVDAENRAAKLLYERFGFRCLRSERVWRLYFSASHIEK